LIIMISLIDSNGNVSIQSCCANEFQISKEYHLGVSS